MIRVLQVLGGLNRGGAETFVINLHKSIDRSKVQFDYVIHTDKPQDYSEDVKKLGGRIFCFPVFNGKNILEIRNKWEQFFNEHPEFKILHSHVRSYASVYIPLAKKHGLTTIIHSHNTSNGSGMNAFVKRIFQIPLRYQADYFFGCSFNAGKWLFGNRVVNSDRYFTINNAIDIEKFEFNEKVRERLRNEFKAKEDGLLIGTVGRLTQQKNPDGIISICSILKCKGVNFKFIWVGTGELEREIRGKIIQNNLEDVIIMAGVRNDVNDIFQALDVFILPSLWEGLPVVAVEAQAAGLPCYISDNISKEVNISSVLHYLPISKKMDNWATMISAMQHIRKDTKKELIDNGFSIIAISDWLTEFYQKKYEEKA